MIAVICIAMASCAVMIGSVLFKPSVNVKGFSLGLYWIAPLLGALIILIGGFLPLNTLLNDLTADTAVNPIKLLVIFTSLAVLSIFLDETGLFKFLADKTLRLAKSNQRILFVCLYLLVSILTVFTSNDIIVLTFTPFICYFAKNAKINPIPYLVAEFVAANTWSLALVIGNPTNIYLATSAGIGFIQYVKVMILPTVFCGITAFAVLFLLFRKSLKTELTPSFEDKVIIEDKPLLIIGVIHLLVCTVLLAISSYIGLEMWIITLSSAVSLLLFDLVYKAVKKQKPIEIARCLKRAPWELIPFVLSMFVLVSALDNCGATQAFGSFLGSGDYTVWKYGLSSMLAANLINNIPMSVFYTSVLQTLPAEYFTQGVYATIIGSNIGAFLTPVGALAGVMWSGILKTNNIKFPFYKFVLYGFTVGVPVAIAALLGLLIVF